jgi:hypothetical protein
MTIAPLRGGNDLLPRYLLLEPLFAGHRLLEVGALGPIGTAGAELCVERGAKTVVSLGSREEIARVSRPDLPPAIELRAPDAMTDFIKFEAIVLHDATAVLASADAERFRQLLAPGGRLLAVVPNPLAPDLGAPVPAGGPAYASVHAQLGKAFHSIEVIFQSPLLGYTFAPSGIEKPEASVDGSLAGPVEPSHYLLLCGQEPPAPRELAVVALPSRPLLERPTALHDEAEHLERDLQILSKLEARANLRAGAAEAQSATTAANLQELRELLEKTRAEADRLRSALAAAEAAAQASAGLHAELDRLKSELVAAQQQRLQAVTGTGDRDAQAEISSWKSQADRFRDLLEKSQAELETVRRERAESQAAAEVARELRTERDRLSAALTSVQTDLRQLASLPPAMLGHGGEHVDEELRRELAERTERIVKLVSELSSLHRAQ